jgi:hypothetical protein
MTLFYFIINSFTENNKTMMILKALFFLIWCISVNTHYTLYYSDIRQGSYPTFDCLYAYLIDDDRETGKRYIRNYHLIPYCRRPDYDNEEQDVITENIEKTISFKELKMQNITSEQLLQWFAPIDVAEKYEINLNDSDVFHNCSSPWFGSQCQYKFDYDLSLSFNDIVQVTFNNQSQMNLNITSGTCYRFLTDCIRDLWPLCLDWREICDGKIDCMNGEDEEWCDQLEMNQCNDNEYRCHYGGQCIPLIFVKDSKVSVDCLDGSDETDYLTRHLSLRNSFCFDVVTFRCQERISQYPWSFQCGDGQYVSNIIIPTVRNYCLNRRNNELSRFILTSMDHISNISCQKAFYCALHFNRTFNLGKKINKFFINWLKYFRVKWINTWYILLSNS